MIIIEGNYDENEKRAVQLYLGPDRIRQANFVACHLQPPCITARRSPSGLLSNERIICHAASDGK